MATSRPQREALVEAGALDYSLENALPQGDWAVLRERE